MGSIRRQGPMSRLVSSLSIQLWLRFQLNYLGGFPYIMGIALLYAHYIGFDAFNPS